MLDDWIAGLSDGTTIWLVLLVAVLLGLRHATDPDHLAAVTTLVAGGKTGSPARPGELGLAWGAGHATTLFVFGLPILLLNRYLPARVEQGAETAIGLVIVYLGVRLIVRWKRGALSPARRRRPTCTCRRERVSAPTGSGSCTAWEEAAESPYWCSRP